MITPAEITWPVIILLVIAAIRIMWVLTNTEEPPNPTAPVGRSIERPAWVKVCDRPGCVITADHKHGLTAGEQFLAETDAHWWGLLHAEAMRTEILLLQASQVLGSAQAA